MCLPFCFALPCLRSSFKALGLRYFIKWIGKPHHKAHEEICQQEKEAIERQRHCKWRATDYTEQLRRWTRKAGWRNMLGKYYWWHIVGTKYLLTKGVKQRKKDGPTVDTASFVTLFRQGPYALSCLWSRGGPIVMQILPIPKREKGVFWAVWLMPKLLASLHSDALPSHVYRHNAGVLDPRGFLASKWRPTPPEFVCTRTRLGWLFFRRPVNEMEVQPER